MAHFYDVLDPSFDSLINKNAKIERLYNGMLWAEGPVYFAESGYLLWSDIPNDRMLR